MASNQLRTSLETKLSLPLLPTTPPAAWEGFQVIDGETPEPFFPQGAYSDVAETELTLPLMDVDPSRPVELLAPAGGMEAGQAAFHFGADAIYLGLKKFSARAEAENFTLAECEEITAFAHSLTPPRRVFVTINTVIRQDELPELVEVLVHLEDMGVDAVILQDLGVYHLLKEQFPRLERHGSTQMAVHNRAGAEALKALGFERVVLARELTFEEVRDITQAAGIETEVFIHGALCYSYSGLCLFSSQNLGRSGNRGKCAYSCRDSYEVEGAPLTLRDGNDVKRDPRTGFPFSMKDLALPDHLPALRAAGVSCFKIEGRKKSPLYVATTTEYYRRLLAGELPAEERPEREADLQTVFSRPWTRLFVQSHKDKEVADRDTVGHRGTLIGKVEQVRRQPGKPSLLRFRTERDLQRHDGLQVDLPHLGKPFGFAVDRLFAIESKKSSEVFEAREGSLVEVELPREHPHLPEGAPVYCSSSQEVKQRYHFDKPKPGEHRRQHPLFVQGALDDAGVTFRAWTEGPDGGRIEAVRQVPGPFSAAQDLQAMDTAVRGAFQRLGQSAFCLEQLDWQNSARGFVPVSRLNALRRELIEELTQKRGAAVHRRVETLRQSVCVPTITATTETNKPFAWSIKVDRIEALDAFGVADADLDELIIDIARDHPHVLQEKLARLETIFGRERVRLALPPLTRAWEEKGLVRKIHDLRAAGWNKWEAANLSAWSYLGVDPNEPAQAGLDLATDWSLYVVNRLAARQMLRMGATRFALSPEDGRENIQSLLTEFPEEAVLIIYQDTPLFLAESCAYANLIGGCPGKANCNFESMQMVSSHGEKVTALDYHCRTIVLDQGPFCLSTRLKDIRKRGARRLRMDFIYRPYAAAEVKRLWETVRAGQAVRGGHAANWERGML